MDGEHMNTNSTTAPEPGISTPTALILLLVLALVAAIYFFYMPA